MELQIACIWATTVLVLGTFAIVAFYSWLKVKYGPNKPYVHPFLQDSLFKSPSFEWKLTETTKVPQVKKKKIAAKGDK